MERFYNRYRMVNIDRRLRTIDPIFPSFEPTEFLRVLGCRLSPAPGKARASYLSRASNSHPSWIWPENGLAYPHHNFPLIVISIYAGVQAANPIRKPASPSPAVKPDQNEDFDSYAPLRRHCVPIDRQRADKIFATLRQVHVIRQNPLDVFDQPGRQVRLRIFALWTKLAIMIHRLCWNPAPSIQVENWWFSRRKSTQTLSRFVI